MDARNRRHGIIRMMQPAMTAALGVLTLMTLLLEWISVCGSSSGACAAWCLAVAVGAGVAQVLQRVAARSSTMVMAAAVAAVLSIVTVPVGYETCLTLAASTGLPGIAIWLTAALPALAGSVACHLLLLLPEKVAPARRLAGCTAGATLFVLYAWFSPPFELTAAALAAAVVLAAVREMRVAGSEPELGPNPAGRIKILPMVLNMAAGLGLVAGVMILHRVFSVSLMAVAVAAAITGVSLLPAMLSNWQPVRRSWIVWLCCLCVLALLPWCYTSAIGWNLQLRATASTGAGMILCQGLQLAFWSIPLVLATISVCHVTESESAVPQVLPAAVFVGAAVGWTVCVLGIAPTWSALLSIVMIAGVPAVLLWRIPAVSRRFHRLRVAGSVLAAAAVAGLVVCPPDLAGPSRLLFTTRPLAAVHRGIAREMIPETDAARIIVVDETSEGTLTTWKIEARALEFRLNGHQIGVVSDDGSTMPQPAADVLACVLPLVLHRNPGSVLLLDDYSGVARETCGQFPLHRIVFVEPESTCAQGSAVKPMDGQLQVLSSAPESAIRDASIEPVDVVISVLADPSRIASLSRLSASWFRAASERLTADGVFCQRIRFNHVGGDSLLHLLGSVSSAFQNVAVVQLVPGEIALVATNSSGPLLDKDVLKRMERQHVRRQLGRCGWDWCQLAALPIVSSSDSAEPWGQRQLPVPDSVFGLRLGWETVRPVNHGRSLRQLLAPHERRIAEAAPVSPTHEEFRRRISAYAQQVEVVTAFPDQPWVYRKSLKSEIQRNQRRPVEVIVDGQIHHRRHPLDEFRISYLETLGELLKRANAGELSAPELHRLSEFSADYEPLISDFAHHELVRLHELARHPSPQDEFRHRLHTIHFTQPSDASVRNVVGALDQLTSQPELVPDHAERFDQLNSLVQHLIVRWEVRTGFEPRSAVRMQRDVELSVRTVQTALSQMEQLAAAAGKGRRAFLTRRQFVSQALIGPLRDYEKQVLAHWAKSAPKLVPEDDQDSDRFSGGVLPMTN